MSDTPFIKQGLELLGYPATMTSTLTNLVQLAVKAARSEAGSLFLLDEQRQVLKRAVTIAVAK